MHSLKFYLLIGLVFSLLPNQSAKACSCVSDFKTLSEKLFQGKPGTVFLCRIKKTYLDSAEIRSTAEVLEVFYGQVPARNVLLYTGHNESEKFGSSFCSSSSFNAGDTVIVFSQGSKGSAQYYAGGACDQWTHLVNKEILPSWYMKMVRKFSTIHSQQLSQEYSFKTEKNILLTSGRFNAGRPVGIWEHFDEDGRLSTRYNLDSGITTRFEGNNLWSRTIKSGDTIHEQAYTLPKGHLNYISKAFPTAHGNQTQYRNFFEDGHLKMEYAYIQYKRTPEQKQPKWGHTGPYRIFYDNGQLKTEGKYMLAEEAKNEGEVGRQVGIWLYYKEDGALEKEHDYGDGH